MARVLWIPNHHLETVVAENVVARVSTSTDGSSTRPRTARTAWVGASYTLVRW